MVADPMQTETNVHIDEVMLVKVIAELTHGLQRDNASFYGVIGQIGPAANQADHAPIVWSKPTALRLATAAVFDLRTASR